MQTTEEIAAERVAKARGELILAQTFYGVLVSHCTPIASTKVPTMATNGKTHFYNPTFIATLTQAELLGVQAHETEHDARRHHTRRNGRDPDEWNIACDYAINIDLINAGFTLPKGAYIDARYAGLSAEDIYRMRELDQQQQQPQQQPQPEAGDQQDDADDADEEQDGGEEQDGDEPGGQDSEAGDDESDDAGKDGEGSDGTEGEDDAEGSGDGSGEPDADGDDGTGSASGDAGETGDDQAGGAGEGSGESPGEAGAGAGSEPQSHGDPGGCGEVLDAADDVAELADEDAKWERVMRQAAMLAAKRGDAPGHISREIERADHPPQDWRETLRAFFDGGAATRETWSRPNRRFIGGGLYLPGREREGVNRAAILIDTSGSMDVIALAAIMVETQAALDENVIEEIVVVYGDTRVTRVDTYRCGEEIEFDPRGGGGTVLQPLFDHVRDEVDASLIVCFTDGYIDINSDSPEPACPVLWAFTGYPDEVRKHIANAPWGAAGIDVGSH